MLSCILLQGQESEFKLYPNGLIYSERTMARLTHYVDSLNLQFKTCDMNRKFYACHQTLGVVIKYSGPGVKQALQDLENGVTAQQFIQKYPKSEAVNDALILRSLETGNGNKKYVQFKFFNPSENYNPTIETDDISLLNADMKGRWVTEHSKATQYSKESLTAFYFPENFRSARLPQRYEMMIAYADCMIDTSESKMKRPERSDYTGLPVGWEKLSQREMAALLEEKRKTSVWGYCSMDQSPRLHAIDIAVLSAETYNWPVFLKAHLDVMNDRFDRASDGSYAWGARQTYIKELEELNIHVHDLMLGITFRFSDPAVHHYFGSVGRIGRALAETKDSTGIEQSILTVIADRELDTYNRLVFYFLFLNYNHFVTGDVRKEANKVRLMEAVKTLPEGIQEQIMKRKD